MKIDIITVYPNYLKAIFTLDFERAKEKGLLTVNVYNLRDYTLINMAR